jgi:hypothetical protein
MAVAERRRTEGRVREAMRELQAPEEPQAEQRARQVVDAAFREREPSRARPRIALRIASAVAAVAAVAGFALTPAGADVREWIANAMDPGEKNAEPRLNSLPVPGSVLVDAPSGAWIIRDDGSKRHLGAYEGATWSPSGRFIGVSDGTELRAVDPVGNFRWSIESPEPIDALDWSPDEGFRVAYLAGDQIRVVAGDGTGDRFLLGPARPVRPVWRPESDGSQAIHRLTYVDADGRVILVDADSEKVVWRSAEVVDPVADLEWSADGRVLLVESEGWMTLLNAKGEPVFRGPLGAGEGVGHASLSPSGNAVAVARKVKSGHELVLIPIGGGRERVLYRTDHKSRGEEFDSPVFSPDSKWVLLPWRAADQWLFIRIADKRVIAVADIARQFDSDGTGRAAFPRVAGWCC